ncbi:MAG TPA: sialidase family protein [Bryobacteraceae bacterium]|nr:sialidase family protein [Bryobacteraceae bacterium]
MLRRIVMVSLAVIVLEVAAQVPRAASTLTVSARVDHVDVAGREPMVVEHPDGSLFAAAYGNPPRPTLWKSSDHGATWTRVDVGAEADGAIGNSDVALAIARDGTLYFANLLFDRDRREGSQVSVAVSRDVGKTWRWSVLTKERFADRPWVGVARNGVAHVVWSDGTGVHHAVSSDRGVNWSERPRVLSTGGSSHLAVGPGGELAVRVSPLYAAGSRFAPAVDQIAISTDGGESWQDRTAPGEHKWSENLRTFPPRWVEPLAWDASGGLYSFWTNAEGLWLARSENRGESWTTWNLAKSEEPAYFPYLIARRRGELAVSWFSGRDASLRLHVGEIDATSRDKPRLLEAEPVLLDSWSRGNPPARNTAGEYVGVTFLSNVGIGAVTPIFNPAENRFGFTWWRFEAH